MRPDCSWSMSTAGLTAQQICLPAESLYLSGSYCHRMAGSKPSSNYHHDPENLYFSMDPSHMEYSPRVQQQVPPPPSLSYERQKHSPGSMRLPPKKSRPALLSFTSTTEPSTPSPAEDDQVVPSFQRLSVYERSSPPQTPGRCAKPLPPLPGWSEPSPDQAMDNEVESFTSSDDSSCLVPDHCPKSSPFRYLTPSRRSFRNCGQINYAYFEGSTGHQKAQPQQGGVRELPEQQPPEPPEPPAPPTPVIQRHQERAQRKLRRSHSGPAGSFNKPTGLRVSCHQRYGQAMDKPEVPPRVPIPPRPAKSVDIRRWSAEVSSGAHSDEDRPPRVPPRDPLNPSNCRTPSPKSLPIYVNGVMPSTQSFAPDPKYVSTHRGLQRQNSEGSPCILPVVENGRKASATHYFLLPQRPAYLDKPCFDKFFRETDSTTGRGGQPPNSTWDCQTRRKAHVDLV